MALYSIHPGCRHMLGIMDWALGVPLENEQGMKSYILIELNPNILGRDVERMASISMLV